MADDSRDAVTPFTTSANFAGSVREVLWTSTNASMSIGAVVREVLITGIGLGGTGHTASSIRATLATSAGGVTLGGRIESMGRARVAALNVISLAGRAESTSGERAAYLMRISLAGRITSEAETRINLPGVRGVAARGTAGSSARGSITLGMRMAGRIESMAHAGLVQLPTRVDIGGRIAGRSRASVYIPIPTNLPGARISAKSGARLFWPASPGSKLGQAVSLHM